MPATTDQAESKTYLAGYISTFPDGYEIGIDTGSKNPAAATIVYLLSDPAVTAVQKQNPEVQKKTGSAIKGLPVTLVSGNEYAVIEVPIMSY